jgi:hypothetical protein
MVSGLAAGGILAITGSTLGVAFAVVVGDATVVVVELLDAVVGTVVEASGVGEPEVHAAVTSSATRPAAYGRARLVTVPRSAKVIGITSCRS